MSKHTEEQSRVTVRTLRKRKEEGRKLSMITCYDAAFGALIDRTEIDMILVGDSLGNVVLGFENTIPVTMEHMLHHTAAVSRVIKRAMLVADMPFLSYNLSVEQALHNAGRLVQEAGAHAVKLEGGVSILPQVRAIVQAGIPVIGHLGLTPQSIHTLGGYRVQGRGEEAAERLASDAAALAEVGVCALVMELVPAQLAQNISKALSIPTIGIGAGGATDGQVLVLHDLLGFQNDFTPKFLKRYARIGDLVVDAVSRYDEEVKQGQFPGPEHSFLT